MNFPVQINCGHQFKCASYTMFRMARASGSKERQETAVAVEKYCHLYVLLQISLRV